MKSTNKNQLVDIELKKVTKKYFMCKNDMERLLLIIAPWKKHQVKTAINDLNLKIYKGEKIAIIGKNGAGKSTIVKMISSAVIPSSGKVILHRRVSCILDVGSGLEPDFTGRENIFIRGAILGYTRKQIQVHVDEIIDFCDIKEYIDLELKRYSAGMTAKLSVSIALHLDPEILIVDEALSVGDISFNNKFKQKINELSKKSDITLILISHNEETIFDLCKRGIIIHDNVVKFDGKVDEAMSAYHKILGVQSYAEKEISKHKETTKPH